MTDKSLCNFAWAMQFETDNFVRCFDARIGRTDAVLQQLFELLGGEIKTEWTGQLDWTKKSVVDLTEAQIKAISRRAQADCIRTIYASKFVTDPTGEFIEKAPSATPGCLHLLLRIQKMFTAPHPGHTRILKKCIDSKDLQVIEKASTLFQIPTDCDMPFADLLTLCNRLLFTFSVATQEQRQQNISIVAIVQQQILSKQIGRTTDLNIKEELLQAWSLVMGEQGRVMQQLKQDQYAAPPQAYSLHKKQIVEVRSNLYEYLNELEDATDYLPVFERIPKPLVSEFALTFAWILGRCESRSEKKSIATILPPVNDPWTMNPMLTAISLGKLFQIQVNREIEIELERD